MSVKSISNHQSYDAAVITVCVDPALGEDLIRAVEQMPWGVASVSFDSYISSARRPYFAPHINTAKACIAIVDFDVDALQAIEATRYLRQLFPGRITVIALAENRDPELLLLAMRAGCGEFLHKPVDEGAFRETLQRIETQWTNLAGAPINTGNVLTFLGVKGGVGTTTLAVHLAVYLVQYHQKRTLLIDHHPELGHACVYLGLDGARYNYQEAVRSVSRLDSELLRGFVAKHPSGLDVLSSPDLCSGSRSLEPEAVAQTLEFLKGEYDYVIIDCPSDMDDTLSAVLEASANVYLVATPEIGAIRDLSRYVDALMLTDGNTEKMQIVINRVSSRYAVNVENIEKAIRLPVAIRLSNSYADLVRSTNLGEPIGLKNKSEFTGQFMKWANTLVGSTPKAPETKKGSSIFAMWS